MSTSSNSATATALGSPQAAATTRRASTSSSMRLCANRRPPRKPRWVAEAPLLADRAKDRLTTAPWSLFCRAMGAASRSTPKRLDVAVLFDLREACASLAMGAAHPQCPEHLLECPDLETPRRSKRQTERRPNPECVDVAASAASAKSRRVASGTSAHPRRRHVRLACPRQVRPAEVTCQRQGPLRRGAHQPSSPECGRPCRYHKCGVAVGCPEG